MIIGLVVARRSSKGFVGKNIAKVAGKECWKHTLAAARFATSLNKVVISTDEPSITGSASTGLQGLLFDRVIARPAELCKDDGHIMDAVQHAHQECVKEWPDICAMVLLYANVPYRPRDIIDACVKKLQQSRADSCFSLTSTGKHCPEWMFELDSDSRLKPVYPSGTYRRQDLPARYIHDGGAVVMSRDVLEGKVRGTGLYARFGHRLVGVVSKGAIEVDAEEDIALAEWRIARMGEMS